MVTDKLVGVHNILIQSNAMNDGQKKEKATFPKADHLIFSVSSHVNVNVHASKTWMVSHTSCT